MSVIRVVKNENFTVMSNHHLRDKSLSLKAKGLMSQLLSFPNNWSYSIAGLASLSKDGKDAVRSGIEELELAGYVTRSQSHDESGKFNGYEYTIFEVPQIGASPPTAARPMSDNPMTDYPMADNPTQLNTYEEITNVSITNPKKDSRDTRNRHGQYKNVLLSSKELQTLQEEFPTDWSNRIERLSEYIACTGKSYKNHLAVIRSWARKDKQRTQDGKQQKMPDYSYDESEVL